jgi:hypothetical protein
MSGAEDVLSVLTSNSALSITSNCLQFFAQSSTSVTANTTTVAITGITAIACSMAANAFATAMIGLKA